MGFEGWPVICHDTLDLYAVAAEEAQGITQEDQGGQSGFIWHDFGIGQAGMVIDSHVEDFPSGAPLVALALAVSGDAVADAIDPAQFFGIDMDHIAGRVFFVAYDFGLWVKVFQARKTGTPANTGDGRA